MIKLSGKNIFLIFITSFIYNFMVIIFSFLLMEIIDNINQYNSADFKIYSVLAVAAIVGQICFFAVYNVLKGKIAEKQMVIIKTRVLKGIFKFHISYFHKSSVDDYTSFFYNDLGYIKEKYINRIFDLIENFGMLIMAAVSIIFIYPYYAVAIFLIVLIALFLPILFSKKSVSFMQRISEKSQSLMAWLQNNFKGFEVIKSFDISKFIIEEGEVNIAGFENAEYKFDLFMNFVQIGLNFILTILTLLTYIVGGYLVLRQQITMGALIALSQLLFKVASPVVNITSSIGDINSTKNIREKLNEIQYYEPEKKLKLETKTGNNEYIYGLENVSFAYPEQDCIIKNINLLLMKGKKYAIVGENGSGKSTLLKLLAGYFEDYTGNIFLYQNEIRLIDEKDISKAISFITQNGFIFNKSIEENIFVMRENQSTKDIDKYFNALGFDNVLLKHSDGLKYKLDENNTLSGGELQKISILRTLLKNSKILLVDEGDANLDKDSKINLYNIIKEEYYDLVIVVTHQLDESNKNIFDEIIYLEEGQIKKYFHKVG